MNSNTNITPLPARRTLTAMLGLIVAVFALGIASADASAAKFGTKVNKNLQPSNAGTAHDCDANPGGKCTWVMGEAYGNPGGEESPMTGTLKKIKLVAGEAGKFKLQIVKTDALGNTYVVRNGPKIKYQGQDQDNWDTDVYKVEKFKVNTPIGYGERLAIKTKETSTLRCSSGGSNTLLHSPPLGKGGPATPYDDTDGCWMLLQGKVK